MGCPSFSKGPSLATGILRLWLAAGQIEAENPYTRVQLGGQSGVPSYPPPLQIILLQNSCLENPRDRGA